ncbi:MAG: polysaccharide deacetylase family protein [Anaerolineales bacterium]|nr:polysaccharide deacetylase family protein [Anaerolineales bacterium]
MNGKHFSRREFLKLSGAALGALALKPFSPPKLDRPAEHALWKGSPNFPVAALTVDDCYLSSMLQELDIVLSTQPDVKITLFAVGETFENNESKIPGIWRTFYDKGHEYAYHSFSHINPGVQSTETIIEDYDRWFNACARVLGVEPQVRFARPPFGVVTQSFLGMCAARNLIPTMWSTGWGGPYENASSAIRKTSNGDIVLLHTRIEDVKNVKQALEVDLLDTRLRFVTMSELYYMYLVDQNGFNHCTDSPSRLQTCPE